MLLMLPLLLLSLLLLLLLLLPPPVVGVAVSTQHTQQHGISMKRHGANFLSGQWSAPALNSSAARESLAALGAGGGADWLALTFCRFQWSVDSTGPIYAGPRTPTRAQVADLVHAARGQGMRVFLRPCVDPDWSNPATKGTWRGEIGRHFNASDWDTWFGVYDAYLLEVAGWAQSLRVEMLSIGMEYVTASRQAAHWRRLAQRVRAVYTAGPITYCANHGNEGDVQFWDAVDEISVDAYYNLAPQRADPTVAELVAAWEPISASLAALSRKHGATKNQQRVRMGGSGGGGGATAARGDGDGAGGVDLPSGAYMPVNFAEIGYCSVDHANVFPAQCGYSKSLNLTAQENLYRAFYEGPYREPWFSGVFWWAWLTDNENGGPLNTGFTPRGKPAEGVMRKNA